MTDEQLEKAKSLKSNIEHIEKKIFNWNRTEKIGTCNGMFNKETHLSNWEIWLLEDIEMDFETLKARAISKLTYRLHQLEDEYSKL